MPRGRRKKIDQTEVDKLFQFDEVMEDAVEAAPAVAEPEPESGEKPETPAEAEPVEEDADTQPAAENPAPEVTSAIAEETTNDVDGSGDVAPDVDQMDTSKLQDELSNLDILVCGRCHSVFHFTEELLLHKKNDCSGVSEVLTNSFKQDSKPPVWAFVLYKVYKMKQKDADWNKSSWQLYQKWSDLNESVKQTWVEAAKGLQQITSFMPQTPSGPIKKATVQKRALVGAEREKTLLDLQKELEDDNETEMMSSLGLQSNKGKGVKTETNQIWRKPLMKKDGDDEDEVLYTAEKIVAKRANPKTKQSEYLVKWLGYPTDLNTWEQIGNMDSCMKLVHEFEKNLAKQKARKAAEAKEKNLIGYGEVTPLTPGGRPIRHSALKALDQVKEWVGGGGLKRSLDEDDDDDEDPLKVDFQISSSPRKKFQKSPVIVANAKGMHRVDARSVPNLSSGVYIISTQSGLIKVDDSTASKLTACVGGGNDSKLTDSKITMINETEVRKIPASQMTPKIGILRKETALTSSPLVVKKETTTSSTTSGSVNILQRTQRTPLTTRAPLPRPSGQRQIILGGQKHHRPLPGPIISPLRVPTAATKPRVTIKPALRKPQTIIRTVSTPQTIIRKERVVVKQQQQQQEEFVTTLNDSKEDENGGSLCPLTGEIIGEEKTDDGSIPDVDEDGLMHVAVSPGGSLHQVATTAVQQQQRKTEKKRSLLAQRRNIEEQQQQEQEMISIEGEDGVVYHITPEQQQMLLQNGTLTMDTTQDENENRELVIENGEIVERRMSTEGGQEEQEAVLLNQEVEGGIKEEEEANDGEIYGEDGLMTLDSAVQEAVSQAAAAEQAADGKQGEQLVAQIIHADPPTPGSGTRKVVLLLPDGQMIQTDMEEAQYQALEFEK